MSVAGGKLSSVNVTLVAIESVTFMTSLTALRSGTAAALTTTGLPVGGLSSIFATAQNTLSSMVSTNAPIELVAPAFVIRVNCGAPVGPRNVTCGPGFYGTRFNFSCPALRAEAYCAWWDVNASAFSTVGCTAMPSAAAGGAISCSCDHLTEFAARFAAIAAEQRSIFAAAKSLGNPCTLERYPHVPVLLAALLVALGALAFLGARADARGARLFAQSLAADPDVRSLAALEAAHGRAFVLDARLPRADCNEWLTVDLKGIAKGADAGAVAGADVGEHGEHELSAFANATGKVPNLHTASIYLRLAAQLEPLRTEYHGTGSIVLAKAGVGVATLAALAVHASPPPVPPPTSQTTASKIAFHPMGLVTSAATEAATKAASAIAASVARARTSMLDMEKGLLGTTSCSRAVRLRGLLARLFMLRLFYNHPWFSILWKFDPHSPRLLRAAALAAAISLSMFSTAFLYAFSGGAPGADLPPLTIVETFTVGVLSALIEIPAVMILGFVYAAASEEHFACTYPSLSEELRRRRLAEHLLDCATSAELEAGCGDNAVESAAVSEGDDIVRENMSTGWAAAPTVFVCVAPGCVRMIGRHPEQRDAFVRAKKVAAASALAHLDAEDRLAQALEVSPTGGGVAAIARWVIGYVCGCRGGGRRQNKIITVVVVPIARSGAGTCEFGGPASRTAWLTASGVTAGSLFYVTLFGMTQPAGATGTFLTAFVISQLWTSLVWGPAYLAAGLVYKIAVAPAWAPWLEENKSKHVNKTALTGRLEFLTLIRAAGAASALAPDEALAALSKSKAVAAACHVVALVPGNTARTALAVARDALVFRRFLVAQARGAERARARHAAAATSVTSGGGGAGAGAPRRPGDGGDGSEPLLTQRAEDSGAGVGRPLLGAVPPLPLVPSAIPLLPLIVISPKFSPKLVFHRGRLITASVSPQESPTASPRGSSLNERPHILSLSLTGITDTSDLEVSSSLGSARAVIRAASAPAPSPKPPRIPDGTPPPSKSPKFMLKGARGFVMDGSTSSNHRRSVVATLDEPTVGEPPLSVSPSGPGGTDLPAKLYLPLILPQRAATPRLTRVTLPNRRAMPRSARDNGPPSTTPRSPQNEPPLTMTRSSCGPQSS